MSGRPTIADSHSSNAPAPKLVADPWAWVTALLALPLVWTTRGTPRGEAVAEDFDFLRRALLEPGFSLSMAASMRMVRCEGRV